MTTTTAPEGTITELAEQPPAEPPAAEEILKRERRKALKLRTVIAGRYSGPTDTAEMKERAEVLAGAKRAVPVDARGNIGDIFMYLLYAQALDIPEALAFQHVFFSEKGTPGIHAAFMHALLIRAGHRVEVLWADHKKVTLRIRYADGTRSPQVSWHILEAQRAGLHTLFTWRTYSGDMLFARAISRLCRRYAPDVSGGLHTFEDLEDGLDGVDVLAPDDPEEFDPDGNPVVEDDVAEFLQGLDQMTYAEVQQLWVKGGDLGMLGRFAGQVNGVHVAVQEVIYDAGQVALEREAEAGTLVGGGQDHTETAHLDGMHQADEADAQEARQPAGPGNPIGCGCDPQWIAKTGDHMSHCLEYVGPLDQEDKA